MDRVDDLTFKANFTGDGAAKLRERVSEKLKEIMGGYTDDTLVREVAQATILAPQRLLQFAVRDAVATSRPSNLVSEPAQKHLRSVVSASAVDLSVEAHPRRIRSITRVPKAMVTAIKAVKEAAKDVVKNRSSGNVFDRLGCGMEISQASDQLVEFREAAVDNIKYGRLGRVSEKTHTTYLQRSDYTGDLGDMAMLETETAMTSDSTSDNEGCDDDSVMSCRAMNISQIGSSDGKEGQDSMNVQYNVAKNADEIMGKSWKDQDQHASLASNSCKIVNISVNVNTWKPPHYQEPREVSEMDSRKSVQEIEEGLGKSGAWLMKESSNPVTVANRNEKVAADAPKESSKVLPRTPVLYSTGQPTEDADSQTIFVNNIHFASTKDSLSRHFNKFGDVLKVIIVLMQQQGNKKAYVEFMRKETAESTLLLDGTSFMSCILKVARKSSSHQEAAPIMSWPRVERGSPFSPPRFTFSRGIIPSVYRARPPITSGARSLQWKRGAQATPGESGATSSSNRVPFPTV